MASRNTASMKKRLQDGAEALCSTASAQRSSIGELKKDKSKCLRAIIQLRQEVCDFFDNLESEMNTALEGKHSELRHVLEGNERACVESAASLRAIQEELEAAEKEKNATQVGVLMVKAETESAKSQQIIDELKSCNVRLTFQANETLVEMLGKIKSLGRFATGDGNTSELNVQRFLNFDPVIDCQTPRSNRKPLIQKAQAAGSFSIRFEDDEKDCDIIGSAALSDGSILFGDIGNNKLKLIGSDYKQLSFLTLSSFPYEISSSDADDASVYVTLPNERKVQEVRLSRDRRRMSLGRSFVTEGECRAVSRCVSGLAVSVDGPEGEQIHIFNERGTVMKRFQKDEKGNQMFRCPYNSTTLDGGRVLVVSNRGTDSHSVIGLDLTTGARLFRYMDEMLDWPRGLTTDDRGSLYAVGGESHTVHQLGEDGRKVRVLLTSAEELRWPRAITYLSDGRLLVSNKWSPDILIFCVS